MATNKTISELAKEEHERSLAKNRKTVQAYNRDVLGSYEAAQKNAYESALPLSNESITGRSDYKFMQKARSVVFTEMQSQKEKEKRDFNKAYNILKDAEGPAGGITDMPVRITDALGRDIGRLEANVHNTIANAATKAFGDEPLFDSGIGKTSKLNENLDKFDTFSTAAINDITRIVTESPWLEKKIKALREPSDKPLEMKKVNPFFDGVNNIFATGFRSIMRDFADILNEWWHDPRTLCCFIKSIAALAISAGKKAQMEIGRNEISLFNKTISFGKEIQNESYSSIYRKTVKKYFAGDQKFSELTGTREFFDKMITILKMIRSFLVQELNFNFALNLDLGLSMGKASMGALMALLAALQQMLEDKIYNQLMVWTKKYVREEIRQCLPFEKLLRLLADFMSGPDGIFKFIEEFVNSYLIGFQANNQFGFDKNLKTKAMDLAALDKVIKLLEKLRDSILNLELCMEADFSKTDTPTDDANTPLASQLNKSVGLKPGYDAMNNSNTGNRVTYPTDREITAFLIDRLGESPEFAKQVLDSAKANTDITSGRTSGSPDNAGNSSTAGLKMAIGDCARTLNSQRLEELATLIADWEII